MKLHFPKITILFSIALAVPGCSDKPITGAQKEEYRNSRPLLEWIRGAQFERGGREIRVPVKKIGQATAEQRGLVETDGGGARMQLSPKRKLLAVQGGGSSPSLEFAIVDAFSEVSRFIKNEVTNLGASSTESTGFKLAGYGLSSTRTINKVTAGSKTVSESISRTANLTGPDGGNLEYLEDYRLETSSSWDGHPVTEWSLSKSGDLDFKTFLTDLLAATGPGSPEYTLEIFDDPENLTYLALVTVRFSEQNEDE